MVRRNPSAMWNLFKITDDVNKKALCKLCKNEFSFRSTTGNLNAHLRKRHDLNATLTAAEDSDVREPSNSQKILDLLLWNYFDRENHCNQTAKCNVCEEILSYETSTEDLKTHLRNNHGDEYNDYLQDLNPQIQKGSVVKAQTKVKASSSRRDKDDSSNLSKKFCAEVWGHFELRDSNAQCTICDTTTENTIEDMKSHLEEEHPLVFETIPNKDTADSTDAESVQNEETDVFTEVVYLEDKKPKLSLKRKRSISEREDHETERELSTFLNYIRIMLLKVNKKQLSKLQVDIINLIAKQSGGR